MIRAKATSLRFKRVFFEATALGHNRNVTVETHVFVCQTAPGDPGPMANSAYVDRHPIGLLVHNVRQHFESKSVQRTEALLPARFRYDHEFIRCGIVMHDEFVQTTAKKLQLPLTTKSPDTRVEE